MQESVHSVSPAAQVPLAVPFSDGTSQYMELEAWVLHKRVAKRPVGRGIAAFFTDGPMACLLQWGFFFFFFKHPNLPSLEGRTELGSLTSRPAWVLGPW